MELAKFKELCKIIGRSDITEGNEWETVKYVHTPGQGSPAIDVEIMRIKGKIAFVDNEETPGFAITETRASDIMMPLDGQEVTTFFDLNHITDLSFLIDDDVVDIYDIVNRITTVSYPVVIGFKVESTTKYEQTWPVFRFYSPEEVILSFKMSRNLVCGTDYSITFTNIETGSTTDKITEEGEYYVDINCLNQYIGTARAKIIVRKGC